MRFIRFDKTLFFRKQSILQATTLLIIVNFISNVVGYFREVVLAYFFGTTYVMDAYVVGLQIPKLVISIISGGLCMLIIPIYIDYKKNNINNYKEYTLQILYIWSFVVFLFCLVILFFPNLLVKIVAPGFKDEVLNLTITLTRFLVLFNFFGLVNGFFESIFRAEKNFLIPSITPLFTSICEIIFLVLFYKFFGIYALVIASYIMIILDSLVYIYFLNKYYHFFYTSKIKFDWNRIKNFFFLVLPLVISATVGSINQIVDKSMASVFSAGTISAFKFADKIWTLPHTLFAGSFLLVIYPTFSELALDKKNNEKFEKTTKEVIALLIYFMIPVSLFLFQFSQPIVKIMFQRGAFDIRSTLNTSIINQMYCIGIFSANAYPILSRVCYSKKNTIIPLILSIISVGTNVVGNIILSRLFGPKGIALSTSISSIISFFIIYFIVSKKYFTYKLKNNINLLYEFFKILLILVLLYYTFGTLSLNWINKSVSKIIIISKIILISNVMVIIYYNLSKYLKTYGYAYTSIYVIKIYTFFKNKLINIKKNIYHS